MSLNSILSGGTTGLMAAQAGLRAVSDNISNVNTPGYVRKVVTQAPLVAGDVAAGVQVLGTERAANEYLRNASLSASSRFSSGDVVESMLDRAQASFGDPSEETSFFNQLDQIYAAFSNAAEDPTSTLLRATAINRVSTFLSDTEAINQSIHNLISEADSTISGDLDEINGLLDQIDALNSNITRTKSSGDDTAGADSLLDIALDDLSELMGISVVRRGNGGVDVRSVDGVPLTGEGGQRLSYRVDQGGFGAIEMTSEAGGVQPLRGSIGGGRVGGLLSVRNVELPALQQQVAEFSSKAVDELNRAHNSGTASPPPRVLTGRDTGVDLPTSITGFSGTTNIGIVDSTGSLVRRVEIAFNGSGGTMSVDGAAPSAFSAASFLADLNTAMGGMATASFANRSLSIGATLSTNGIAIAEDTTAASSKAGRSFSHFFGLNDLVTATGPTQYATGLAATDAHGFTAGETLTFRIVDGAGNRVAQKAVAIPAGTNMQDLVNQLNSGINGLGQYGSFALDAEGTLRYAPLAGHNNAIAVVADETSRGVGGPSVSSLFGLGPTDRIARTERYAVNTDLVSDDRKLALSNLDIAAALAGKKAVVPGDSRGGLALAKAGENVTTFEAAGNLTSTRMTVSRYASELAGAVGRRSANAQQEREAADALLTEAKARRSGAEGVNLDEELISMTIYQQAYNASARLLTAATEMYDTLLAMGR